MFTVAGVLLMIVYVLIAVLIINVIVSKIVMYNKKYRKTRLDFRRYRRYGRYAFLK